jgi:hypothetical protein
MPRAVYPLYKAYHGPLGEPVSAGPPGPEQPRPGPGWTRRGVLTAIAVAVGAGVLIVGFVALVSSLQPSQSDAVTPALALASAPPVAETPADASPDLIASGNNNSELADRDVSKRGDFSPGTTLEGLVFVVPMADVDQVEGTDKERRRIEQNVKKCLERKLLEENIPTTGEGNWAFVTYKLSTTEPTRGYVVWDLTLQVHQSAVIKANGLVRPVQTWEHGYSGKGSTLEFAAQLRESMDNTAKKLGDDWRRGHERSAPKPVPAGTGKRSSRCDPPPARRPVPQTARHRGEPTLAPAGAVFGEQHGKP